MKSVIILFITFIAALANAKFILEEPEACETCRVGTGLLLASGLTAESISQQEEILMNEVCPHAPEEAGCIIGVLSWWKGIANVVFNEAAVAPICHELNNGCMAFRPK